MPPPLHALHGGVCRCHSSWWDWLPALPPLNLSLTISILIHCQTCSHPHTHTHRHTPTQYGTPQHAQPSHIERLACAAARQLVQASPWHFIFFFLLLQRHTRQRFFFFSGRADKAQEMWPKLEDSTLSFLFTLLFFLSPLKPAMNTAMTIWTAQWGTFMGQVGNTAMTIWTIQMGDFHGTCGFTIDGLDAPVIGKWGSLGAVGRYVSTSPQDQREAYFTP